MSTARGRTPPGVPDPDTSLARAVSPRRPEVSASQLSWLLAPPLDTGVTGPFPDPGVCCYQRPPFPGISSQFRRQTLPPCVGGMRAARGSEPSWYLS